MHRTDPQFHLFWKHLQPSFSPTSIPYLKPSRSFQNHKSNFSSLHNAEEAKQSGPALPHEPAVPRALASLTLLLRRPLHCLFPFLDAGCQLTSYGSLQTAHSSRQSLSTGNFLSSLTEMQTSEEQGPCYRVAVLGLSPRSKSARGRGGAQCL